MYPERSLDFDLGAAAAEEEDAVAFIAAVKMRSGSSSAGIDFESDEGTCGGKCEEEDREEG